MVTCLTFSVLFYIITRIRTGFPFTLTWLWNVKQFNHGKARPRSGSGNGYLVSWNVAYATGTPGVELKDYVMKDCLLIPYFTKQNKPDLVMKCGFCFTFYSTFSLKVNVKQKPHFMDIYTVSVCSIEFKSNRNSNQPPTVNRSFCLDDEPQLCLNG